MIFSVFSAFHVGHHHDHLADMMANMKPSQSDEDKAPRPGLAGLAGRGVGVRGIIQRCSHGESRFKKTANLLQITIS